MPEPTTASEGAAAASPGELRPWADRAALFAGLTACGWAVASWMPTVLPAWPAASLGLLAMVLASPRGRALPRAIGAFLGLVALVAASAQIAAVWGIAVALDV